VHALVNFYFIDSGQLERGIGQALHNLKMFHVEQNGFASLKCSTWNNFGSLRGRDFLVRAS